LVGCPWVWMEWNFEKKQALKTPRKVAGTALKAPGGARRKKTLESPVARVCFLENNGFLVP